MTDNLISVKYKALYKDTFKATLAATSNEQIAESVATERVLAAALITVGQARCEMIVVDHIQTAFGTSRGYVNEECVG